MLNALITRNEIFNVHTGVDVTNGINPYLISNAIYDSSNAIRAGSTQILSIIGNTIDTCDQAIYLDSSSDATISSNNITFNNHGLYRTSDTSVNMSYNNLFYTLDKWNIAPNDFTGNIGDLPTDDPSYVNRSAKDYHIGTGSPNIGTGQNNIDPYNIDFDGKSR